LLMAHALKEELSNQNVLKYIEHRENIEVRVRGGKGKGKVVKGIRIFLH